MKSILKKIYAENKFQVELITDDIMFSSKKGQEYFLTVKYIEDEFSIFFDSEKTNKVIEEFEKLKLHSNDVKKNTSLIVYVETNSIENFYKLHRNMIFSIEEDEYFFRKYVIVYTNESIRTIICKKDSIDKLIHSILLEDKRIDEFQEKYYKDEVFFVAMQLMVKLPFLFLKNRTSEFRPLNKKIVDVLSNRGLVQEYKLLNTFKENQQAEEYLDNLELSFLSEEVDDDLLNNFYHYFEVTSL